MRRNTIATLALLFFSMAAVPQDSTDREDLEKKKAELDRKASDLLWDHAQKFSQAEDLEGEAVLAATAYFLTSQKEILSGAWKLPKEGADKEWDKVQKAYDRLRSGQTSKADAKLMEAFAKIAGSPAGDEPGSTRGAASIEMKGWLGFDVTIRDDKGKLKIEYRACDQKNSSKEAKVKLLEAIKKMFDNARIRSAVDEELKKLESGGSGESNSKVNDSTPTTSAGNDGDSIAAQYLKLSKEASDKGLKDEALNCEVLSYQIRYLPEVIEGLRLLNKYRRIAGLKSVGYAALLSYGCTLHSRYLAHESPETIYGLRAHEEIEQSSYRTTLGAQAGKKSVISSGTVVESIQRWMATFYHRISLLDPNLEKVGIGRWSRGSLYNVCLDSLAGVSMLPEPGVVAYPANNQIDVPTCFDSFGEAPNPLPPDAESVGYPITVSIFPSVKGRVEGVKARVADGSQANVECWISWPGNPAEATEPENASSICLIPKKPLKSGSSYQVEIEARVGSERKSWSWSFATSK